MSTIITEDGKYIFGSTNEDGRIAICSTLLEDGKIISFLPYPYFSGRDGGIGSHLQGGVGR